MTAAHRLYESAPTEHRQTMLVMRERILALVPDAKEVVTYGMPAFRVEGGIVAGMMANKAFVGYYPFSGSILAQFPDQLASYKQTKSALHVPLGKPLSKSLLRLLLRARVTEIAAKAASSAPRRTSQLEPADADAFWHSLGISAPARRALTQNSITSLVGLTHWTRADLRALHGMGPHALARIEAAMQQVGVTFKPG